MNPSQRLDPDGAIRLLGALIVLIGVWFAADHFGILVGTYFPGPKSVLRAVTDIQPSLWIQAISTVALVIIGFVTGVLIAWFVASLMLTSKSVESVTRPFLALLTGVPPVCYIPFFILWFGFDPSGKIILIALNVVLATVPQMVQVVRSISPDVLLAWKAAGRSWSDFVFFHALQAIAHALLPTLRFTLGFCMIVAIVAESMGSVLGLGHIISVALSTFSLASVVAVAIFAAVAAWLLDLVLLTVFYLLVRWRPL